MFNKTFLRNYLKLLRDKYFQEVLIIPSMMVVIVIDAINSGAFGLLDSIAILLPALYLLYVFYDTLDSTVALTIKLQSGYSVCLGKSKTEFADSLRKQIDILQRRKINLSKVFTYYRVLDFDWQFYESSLTYPIEWENSVVRINEHFLLYAQRIPLHTKLHLFLIAPSPLTIGLGFKIGKHRSWAIYHYDKSRTQYSVVYEANRSNSKLAKGEYDYISINETGSDNSSEIVVILSFITKANLKIPDISERVIELALKASELSPADFAGIALEAADYLNSMIRQGKTIHLFPGLPISVAFMIGKELDEQANICVYNPNRITGMWECVLKLQELQVEA